MSTIKSVLLDGVSGPSELKDFLNQVPTFRDHVQTNKYTIADVITDLYNVSFCHHPYPANFDTLDLTDADLQDFLHSIIVVARNKISRIEAVYEDGLW